MRLSLFYGTNAKPLNLLNHILHTCLSHLQSPQCICLPSHILPEGLFRGHATDVSTHTRVAPNRLVTSIAYACIRKQVKIRSIQEN